MLLTPGLSPPYVICLLPPPGSQQRCTSCSEPVDLSPRTPPALLPPSTLASFFARPERIRLPGSCVRESMMSDALTLQGRPRRISASYPRHPSPGRIISPKAVSLSRLPRCSLFCPPLTWLIAAVHPCSPNSTPFLCRDIYGMLACIFTPRDSAKIGTNKSRETKNTS